MCDRTVSWCCQSDTPWPSRTAVLRDRRWPPNTKIDPEKQRKVCVCMCVCVCVCVCACVCACV